MSSKKISRRKFIGNTLTGSLGLYTGVSAKSYSKILGANDKINIAFLGTGARSRGHMNMVEMSYKDKNLRAVAVCDLWTNNRERAAGICKEKGISIPIPLFLAEIIIFPFTLGYSYFMD